MVRQWKCVDANEAVARVPYPFGADNESGVTCSASSRVVVVLMEPASLLSQDFVEVERVHVGAVTGKGDGEACVAHLDAAAKSDGSRGQ